MLHLCVGVILFVVAVVECCQINKSWCPLRPAAVGASGGRGALVPVVSSLVVPVFPLVSGAFSVVGVFGAVIGALGELIRLVNLINWIGWIK